MTTDLLLRLRSLGALLIGLTLGVVIGGCSSEEPTFPDGSFVVVANSDIGIGPSRILVGVIGEDGQRLGSPDDHVSLSIEATDGVAATIETTATWTWILEPAIGLWRADVDLPRAGSWEVTVLPTAGGSPQPGFFVAHETTIAPDIGDPAPAPRTPTIDDTPLASLTTDAQPDERFYRSSVHELVDAGTESVIVFATPAFCTSAACGPLLDITKAIAPEYPDVEFVHVEVYTGFDEPGFVPNAESIAPALGPEYWNLPSEPWVFVIDDRGLVAARFEGVMAPEELRSALDAS